MKKNIFGLLVVFFIWPCFNQALFAKAANSRDVVINEIAWMGTNASYSHEWIELYNNTETNINLNGWHLQADDQSPHINLTGLISAKGFYLLERTSDQTISNITADQIYTGALKNSSEHLKLIDESGNLVDEVNNTNNWFAGDNISKATMERKNALTSGNAADNWATNNQQTVNGQDADGNPINGTPRSQNSVSIITLFSAPEPEPESGSETEPEAPAPETELQPDQTLFPESSTTPIQTTTPIESPNQNGNNLGPAPSEIFNQPIEETNEFDSESDATPIFQPIKMPSYSTDLIINEFMPFPAEGKEWVELFNNGQVSIDLSGWQIIDLADNKQILSGQIQSQTFLAVTLNKTMLNNQDDQIYLAQPNGAIIQTIIYQKAVKGLALARKTNSQWTWTTMPSPGQANIFTSFESSSKKIKIEKAEPLNNPTGDNTSSRYAGQNTLQANISNQLAPSNDKAKLIPVILLIIGLSLFNALGLVAYRRRHSVE